MITDRQREILALVANGYSTAEIATRLGIAYATVNVHIENARRTLKARSRSHAVHLLFANP